MAISVFSVIAPMMLVRCLWPEGISSTDTLPESLSLPSESMLLTVKVLISHAISAFSSATSSEYSMKYLLVLRLHPIWIPNTSSIAAL